MKHCINAFLLLALFLTYPAFAKETISGPVQAEVVKVIDGDTIRVQAHLWLGLHKTIKVKFNGAQSPELYSPKCDYERELAEEARDITADAIAGKPVTLIDIQYGKYSDRVIANVLNHEGVDLNTFLFNKALAQPTKTGKRMDWCGDGKQ